MDLGFFKIWGFYPGDWEFFIIWRFLFTVTGDFLKSWDFRQIPGIFAKFPGFISWFWDFFYHRVFLGDGVFFPWDEIPYQKATSASKLYINLGF